MLGEAENKRLTSVGSGTPMGAMLRRYWYPVLLSSDVSGEPSRPRKVSLLGEHLVAFRGSDGQVGLMDELCPHRGASLALGRTEDCIIQCLYHGWKVDRDGRITETPSEPIDSTFKDRIRHIAYPVREAGGLIWTYLGPPDRVPPFPGYEWLDHPDPQLLIYRVRIRANWVQALEGVIDSAHSNILHADNVVANTGASQQTKQTWQRPSTDTRPKIEVEETPYGFRYAAIRVPTIDPERLQYVRVTHFIAPCAAMFPASADMGHMQYFVPLDDESTMMYYIRYGYDGLVLDKEALLNFSGALPGIDIDEDGNGIRTPENNWLQDRDAMESGASFTGIRGVNNQDIAVQESMGPIYDRTREHLGVSDIAVIKARRMLLRSLDECEAEPSAEPLGVNGPHRVAFDQLRAEDGLIPKVQPWHVIGPVTMRAAEHSPVGRQGAPVP